MPSEEVCWIKDQHDLLNFVRRMRHPPREVRLVHGDAHAQAALKAKLLAWAAGAGHEMSVTLGGDHLAEAAEGTTALATV
ncbi:MBL fold metallo-hydrolase RNA specificity domain-containing protein [Billgrantia desiderata]|uniref:MBL fold metallo-hydrolase RNA specificity domain-containing protein n=2 Tax=Billgrantia desiderata TaxID=52021 RepID=UPI002106DD9F|nr:MBL fold metallo-hydrolase RNA specificity domain-containing protein [Halomonas desiderata]